MKINISKTMSFGYNENPKIIAEISGNHNGSKKKFLELIKKAILSGADLIKIQTYEPKDITINSKLDKFKIKEGIWKNKYLWDLYKKAHTPFSWHKDAFKLAKKYNKILFSSPFSIRAVDWLEKFNVKLYKIASFELTDHRLVEYIASKKKPIILSTGMANLKEIKNTLKIIHKFHKKVIIMHCVSGYPTNLNETNLKRINQLKKKFKNSLIGLSDHTKNIYSSISATTLGVVAIEKHFKLKNKYKTIDSEFSINSDQLKILKKTTNDIFISLKNNKIKNVEKLSKSLRRSIFAIKNIRRGEKINLKNTGNFRPLIGIPADKLKKILGKKVKKKISKLQPIYKKDLM